MNSTNLNYCGTVELKIKDKQNTLVYEYHNEGTITLKKAFAMFLTGNSSSANIYLPSLIDLRTTDVVSPSLSDYTTNLKKTINLQDPMYKAVTSNGEQTYAAVISANIPYAQLISGISESNQYILVISCSQVTASDTTADLAYISVPAADLLKFVAGTELAVEWQLKLLNNAPSSEEA